MSAVVVAYHELGCVGLRALLARGVELKAVFTHEDDPSEGGWYGSVAELARAHGVPVHTPDDLNTPEWIEHIAGLAPDHLFSFHYRRMVKRPIRRIPRLGCFNLHTSLLPRYRGRCPLNWQLVHGEQRSGVTLHHMVARADAGDIVDQEAVDVDLDDTALTLYRKLLGAAERLLERRLDDVLAGTAPRRVQDEAEATTFGGRRPKDGEIDWRWSAARVHDLVRAVAPPWPGAFCETGQGKLMVWRTRRVPDAPADAPAEVGRVARVADGRLLARAGDGVLELAEVEVPRGLDLEAGVSLLGEVVA